MHTRLYITYFTTNMYIYANVSFRNLCAQVGSTRRRRWWPTSASHSGAHTPTPSKPPPGWDGYTLSYVHTYRHRQTHIHTDTHALHAPCAHLKTCTCAHTDPQAYTRMHACMGTSTHTRTSTVCAETSTHTYSYIDMVTRTLNISITITTTNAPTTLSPPQTHLHLHPSQHHFHPSQHHFHDSEVCKHSQQFVATALANNKITRVRVHTTGCD